MDKFSNFQCAPNHRFGRSFRFVPELGSTMDAAFEDSERGAPHGHVVLADRQTQARGSRGRQWAGTPGIHLTLSMILRTSLAPQSRPPLTLAVGLGLAECIQELGVPEPQVKWPNDVLVGGKKIAGILVESRGSDGILVVGIGLNVGDDPELVPFEATSLAACGVSRGRSAVLKSLLSHVEQRVEEQIRGGASLTSNALRPWLAWRGRTVECGSVRGVLEDVAEDGALLIRGPAGVRRAVAGRLQLQTEHADRKTQS